MTTISRSEKSAGCVALLVTSRSEVCSAEESSVLTTTPRMEECSVVLAEESSVLTTTPRSEECSVVLA